MTTFFLLRHGETDWDIVNQRKLRGWGNDIVPLTDRGNSQIESAAKTLKSESIEVIVSSPMTRAVQSAAIVGRSLDLPIQVKFDLHEWIPDFTYEWSDYETILAAADDLAKCGGEWPPGESRNWEPLSSVFDRTTGVLKGYLSFKNVLVVCHEYVIYSITGAKPGLGELSKHTMENS